MPISISELIHDPEELERTVFENYLSNLRVSIPGIIVDFNHEKQTATVQPAIKENLLGKPTQLPLLLDVPVCFPRAGGYSLTLPVKAGDECLIVFADMCIDAWWQSGGVQSQTETRRHDLSDAIAIMGITSVPKAVKNYSIDALQLKHEDSDTYIEINEDKIIVKSKELVFNVKENVIINTNNVNTSSKSINTNSNSVNTQSNNMSTSSQNISFSGDSVSISGSTSVNGSFSAGGDSGSADIKGDLTVDGSLNILDCLEVKNDTKLNNLYAEGESVLKNFVYSGIADLVERLKKLEEIVAELSEQIEKEKEGEAEDEIQKT